MFGVSGFLLEMAIFVVTGAVVALRWRTPACLFCQASVKTPCDRTLARTLVGLLALLVLLDVIAFVMATKREPDGGWDAVAIWNLRARFLYRGDQAGWRDGFTETLACTHPDYPLLLPAFIARTWKLAHRETRVVPVATACFFSLGTVGLTLASVSMLRGACQGLLAGLVLAATPALYVQATQYADVPIAFFMLAALAMADHFNVPGLVVLAGASAALAAWTKNEGLLWFVATVLALLTVDRWQRVKAFLAGSAPVLVTIIVFKARFATSGDIFGPAGRVGMVERLTDPTRYALIARTSFSHVWAFGPLLLSPFLILAAYTALAGIAIHGRQRTTVRAGTLALMLTACGYFMVYVLHPLDLGWLLATTLDRLLLQLWPAIVFLFFLVARVPEREGPDDQPVAALRLNQSGQKPF
jgi:hypothetical protein